MISGAFIRIITFFFKKSWFIVLMLLVSHQKHKIVKRFSQQYCLKENMFSQKNTKMDPEVTWAQKACVFPQKNKNLIFWKMDFYSRVHSLEGSFFGMKILQLSNTSLDRGHRNVKKQWKKTEKNAFLLVDSTSAPVWLVCHTSEIY